MNTYTATVKDIYTKEHRHLEINDNDAQSAHKLLLGQTKQTEDIIKMVNSKGLLVFELNRGFCPETQNVSRAGK